LLLFFLFKSFLLFLVVERNSFFNIIFLCHSVQHSGWTGAKNWRESYHVTPHTFSWRASSWLACVCLYL
jgi:hypothetical protein